MIRCEAPNCKMRAYNLSKEQMKLAKNNYIVSFHKFPDDPEQRTAWIEAALQKNWNPPDDGSLCSLHFRDDCFNDTNELYDHALPTIFFNDFRSHIRGIVKEFDLECGFSDDEPETNKKIEKNEAVMESTADSREEIIEFKLTEDEIDVNIMECEEVLVGHEEKLGIEDIPMIESPEVTIKPVKQPIVVPTKLVKQPIVVPTKPVKQPIVIPTKPVKQPTVVPTKPVKQPTVVPTEPVKKPVYKPGPISSKFKKNVAKPSVPLKKFVEKFPDKITETTKNPKEDDDVICIDEVKKPFTNNAPLSTTSSVQSSQPKKTVSRPSTTPISQPSGGEISKKLIDLLKPSSLTKFSVLEPASKSLVMQLLNIVQMANARNDAEGSNACPPSTYIITTKQENKDGVLKEPKILESAVIVKTVTNLVKDIKRGTYNRRDNISMICGSPAIFFIKNVTVKNCDPNMNSIYVITNENLLPHIYKLHANANNGKFVTQRTLIKHIPSGGSKAVGTSNVQELKRQTNQSAPPISSSPTLVYQDVIQSSVNSPNYSKTPPTQLPQSSVNTFKTTTSHSNTSNLKSQISKASTSAPVMVTYSYTSSKLQAPNKSSPNSFTSSSAIKGKTFSGSLNVPKFTIPTIPSVSTTQINKAPVVRGVPSSILTTTASTHFTSNATGTKTTLSVPTAAASNTRMFASTAKPTFYSPSSPQMQFRPNPSLVQRSASTSTSTATSPIVIPTAAIRSVMKPQALPTKPFLPASKIFQSVPMTTPASRALQRNSQPAPIIEPSRSISPEFIFKPIQVETFNTNLTRSSEILYPCSPIPSTSKETPSLKRKWQEVEEDDSDDDIIIEYPPSNEIDDREYIYEQEKEIEALEENITQKEHDINNLKKKISNLKRRFNQVKNPQDTKTDEQLIEEILSKYLDSDGIQFFIGQMKVSGKTYTQFRWSEEDKLFALSLLYKNPIEYNILFQKYTLPSDKTLNKFVTRIKKAETSDTGSAE